MPTFPIDSFRRGVDTRRAAYSRPAGALSKAVNVHITSADEIEVRKAFVEIATLPAGCFGLVALQDTLRTFGSVAAPAMPSGFTYQQLTDPAALAMTSVVDVEPFDGEAFVIAKYGDTTRSFYEGVRVKDLDADVCRFRFSITAGTASAGVNKINSITVGGVDVLGAAVDWTTSHAATAAAIAAQINSFSSSPNYTAYVPTGMAEVVIASPFGTISTGAAVVVTVAGNVVAAPASGSMEAPPTAPTSARTAGEKVYVTSGANMLFSAVLDAPNFSPNSTGGGFINASTHSSGSLTLAGSELFYEDLVFFGKAEGQRWKIEADDANNRRLQTFRGAGLIGSRAALSYLDGPTFFLSRQGVRVIQTRDSSGRSLARGDSKAIDNELVAYLNTLTAGQRSRAILLTEPEDDRIWVIVGDRIFVRSWFAGWEQPAWTEYDPGFTITDYAILDDRLYLLDDERTVYLYGGTTGSEYDLSEALVRIAYINARAPATLKGLHGIDLGIEGTWAVRQALDPDDEDFAVAETVGVFSEQTFNKPQAPIAGQSTHISLEFRHEKAEYARISVINLHYKSDKTD
jgi:hypothetical protein